MRGAAGPALARLLHACAAINARTHAAAPCSALFTATMASRLTASQLRTGITRMVDLAGRRVAM